MVMDLGRMDGPVLVFGGPHSNLEATEAILAEAKRIGIPPARVICTGDVVAFCGDPQATADLVRESGIAVVRGNCEESFGAGGDDCGCGFEEGSQCNLLSVQWFSYASAHLNDDICAWMRDLPPRIDFQLGERTLCAVHGAVSSVNEFIFPSTSDGEIRKELDLAGTDGVICGHSGLPFTRVIDGRLWHNAGVVGEPANDATPRVWYSVLSPAADGIEVDLRALDYDHATAAAKMRERGLPEGYAANLATGIYPTMEYLPEAEIARQGIPLEPNSLLWPAPVAVA